ncbi:hypothetical protein ACFYPN_31995 [Streptomyces sp. NPDC005576]|uniref:hypothetical protein n=1 Tax=Streptomyces sp. NPDC005576 TaxID=3364726 RepID=UPI0036CCF0EC
MPRVAPTVIRASTPAPAKTRDDASDGYHQALAAHRAARETQPICDPLVRAAAERQIRDRAREPEALFGDGRKALEELRTKAAAQQRSTSSDAARARALQRLAAERAELTTLTPARPAAAPLTSGIALSQTQISRKQSGAASWSLADIDRLSAHYGIPVPDLLAGVDRAVHCLPARRRAPAPGAAQLTM